MKSKLCKFRFEQILDYNKHQLLIWAKKIAETSYAKNTNTMDQIKRMTDYKQLDANLSQISAA